MNDALIIATYSHHLAGGETYDGELVSPVAASQFDEIDSGAGLLIMEM
jgi:hypothetical protein